MSLVTLQSALTRQLSEGVGAWAIPRGLAYPLDPFLLGVPRFARKLGFEFPLLIPDNRWILQEDAVYQTDRFTLTAEPTWLRPGDYISLDQRELHQVYDVSSNTVLLSSRLLADHDAGSYVYHHSAVITVEGSYQVGQTSINIDLPLTWFCAAGDVLAFLFDLVTDAPSFVEYTVVTAALVGTTSASSQWFCTLDRELHRDVDDGEEIQLRAYPAYQSRPLKIPQAGASLVGIVGPYLIDWTSVPFLDDLDVTEYQTVQYLDDTLVPSGSAFQCSKNTAVLDAPIRADQFVFWDVAAGGLNYDDDLKRLLGYRDSAGWWWLKYTCAPQLAVPTTVARGVIVTVAKALLLNNDYFLLTDDVDTQRFEYQIDGAYVATPEVAATGSIAVAGIPADNDTFTLDNGLGTVITFEFQFTAGFVATSAANKVVDVQAAALPTDVAVAMETAVMAVRPLLGIAANNVGAVLNLQNDVVTQLGNQPISTAGAWVLGVVGMAGGTDQVETIDVSAATTGIEVALLTAAAINRSTLHIDAHATTTAPSVALTSTIPGAGGNQPILEFVFNPGFVVVGMTGGGGGRAWSFTIKSDEAATLRVRFFPNAWQDFALPAGVDTHVTVQLLATDVSAERIDILVAGTTEGGEIQMTSWGLGRAAPIKALRHTYVAQVYGGHTYCCTGLWAKPIWRSFEDLKLAFNQGGTLDAGYAMV